MTEFAILLIFDGLVMEELFRSFCAFGADKSASAVALLDGAKFAKMTKDLKLLDKNLTSTDVDIIFTKVKPKNESVTYFFTHPLTGSMKFYWQKLVD